MQGLKHPLRAIHHGRVRPHWTDGSSILAGASREDGHEKEGKRDNDRSMGGTCSATTEDLARLHDRRATFSYGESSRDACATSSSGAERIGLSVKNILVMFSSLRSYRNGLSRLYYIIISPMVL